MPSPLDGPQPGTAPEDAPGGRGPTVPDPVRRRAARRLGVGHRAHIRELLASALVGITARRRVDPDHRGLVRVTSATGNGPLVVRDDGVGFTAQEVRWLDAHTDDGLGPVREGLRRYEAALLACFQVADVVEVLTRSALVASAPTMRWVGLADGTVRVSLAEEPLDAPGTEIRLHPRATTRPWCTPESTLEAVLDLADQMPVTVEVDGVEVSNGTTLWSRSVDEQQAWFRERQGVEPLAVLPLSTTVPGVRAVAAVLPYATHPGERPAHRHVVWGLPGAEGTSALVPDWAGFCQVLVDDGRDILTDPGHDDDLVAEQLGRSLLLQLILLGAVRPALFAEVVELHGDALVRRAHEDRDILDLVRSTVPLPTSLGPRTLDVLAGVTGIVPFTDDPLIWAQVRENATRGGILVVDARAPHVARLLDALDSLGLAAPRVSRLRSADLVALGVAS